MNKELARHFLLLTLPSFFLVVLPTWLGINEVKASFTTFRLVFDALVVFFLSWSIATLLYIGYKERSK